MMSVGKQFIDETSLRKCKNESNSCVDPKKCSTVPHTSIEQYWYKGTTIDVDIEYTVCDTCGFEFVDTDQIRRNEHIIREAKEERDRFIRIMKGNTEWDFSQ